MDMASLFLIPVTKSRARYYTKGHLTVRKHRVRHGAVRRDFSSTKQGAKEYNNVQVWAQNLTQCSVPLYSFPGVASGDHC